MIREGSRIADDGIMATDAPVYDAMSAEKIGSVLYAPLPVVADSARSIMNALHVQSEI
jgi:hypothetical protein